jgi:hypothetical protein
MRGRSTVGTVASAIESRGGKTGAGAGAELPPFLLNFDDKRMKTPAMSIARRSMIFLLMLRRWYPEATLSSLSASFTSVAIRSTL